MMTATIQRTTDHYEQLWAMPERNRRACVVVFGKYVNIHTKNYVCSHRQRLDGSSFVAVYREYLILGSNKLKTINYAVLLVHLSCFGIKLLDLAQSAEKMQCLQWF